MYRQKKFYIFLSILLALFFTSKAFAALTLSSMVLTGDTATTVIGGATTTSDLTLQTTSGVGATGADMHFLVGNNGGTEAMTILNSGNVGIGTTGPQAKFHVNGDVLITESNKIGFRYSAGDPGPYSYITGGAGNPISFYNIWSSAGTNKIFSFLSLIAILAKKIPPQRENVK